MIISFGFNGTGGGGGTSDYNDLSNKPQINGVALSGNVTSDQLGIMSIKWYNYADGCFMYAREDCTNDGDYLVHVGTEIEGSRTYAGVTISNGVITGAGYGGVSNIGDGHWAGNKEDANGVTYFFHCWVEGGKIYWQTSSPIQMLDAYGTGSNYEGGLVY